MEVFYFIIIISFFLFLQLQGFRIVQTFANTGNRPREGMFSFQGADISTMLNCRPFFQLSGEAQELFSVRHGPVRAARILPAPHISEYG